MEVLQQISVPIKEKKEDAYEIFLILLQKNPIECAPFPQWTKVVIRIFHHGNVQFILNLYNIDI